MFEKLQKKWKVQGWQLMLILCTFALGGSLTGYASRRLMIFFGIETDWLWILVYIIMVTLLWPIAVLLVSIPLGQFSFFINYLKKMGRRMRIVSAAKKQPVHLAIFASGAGSNAARIIDHFKNHSYIRISAIACNKPGAGVIKIAENAGIPVIMIEKENFFRGDAYVGELKKYNTDWIILAGFLWKVPVQLLKAFPGHIINIHPALLPNYGGKGMYGAFVHQAVIDARDKESGITIHYVDEQYDHGNTIFQAKCVVSTDDTPETLAKKIHQLEHEHYPLVIEGLVK